jgi:hypothetical protein
MAGRLTKYRRRSFDLSNDLTHKVQYNLALEFGGISGPDWDDIPESYKGIFREINRAQLKNVEYYHNSPNDNINAFIY